MLAVITSITGGKDALRTDQNWGMAEWFAFVDKVQGGFGQWQLRPACDLFRCNNRNAKLHKVLATDRFHDYEGSIWLDGNIALKVTPEELFRFCHHLALFRHPERDNVADEAAASLQPKYDPFEMAKQVESYRERGFLKTGLWECGVIVRRHCDPVASFDRRWWAEICRGSQQDQLSFPIAADGLEISTLPGWIRDNANDLVDYQGHCIG